MRAYIDNIPEMPFGTALLRLLRRVEIDKITGCWIWQGDKVGGYGRIGIGSATDGTRKLAVTHRVVFEATRGKIPVGYQLDHLCRNRACINPNHLQPVTHAENVRRGDAGKHHAIKTHCPHGHEYDDKNTYHNNGRRVCRECRRVLGRRLYWKNKSMAEAGI